MTSVLALLVLGLQALAVCPAFAQTFAECQAWLCLPAGFSTQGGWPTTACDPAQQAVLRRLRLHMDPLPPWARCAARFGWDAANLTWTMPVQQSCPHGGRVNAAGLCQDTDAGGCTVTYTPRERGHVWVWVDGAKTGAALPYTLAKAGAVTIDPLSCPPTPEITCSACPPPSDSDGPALNVGIHGDAAGDAGDAGGAGGLGGLGGLGGGVGGLN